MTREEMETICVYVEASGEWEVYSCVPKHIRKLTKLYGEPAKVLGRGAGGIVTAASWTVGPKDVVFRKAVKRQLSEVERARLSERFGRAAFVAGAQPDSEENGKNDHSGEES